METEDSMGSAEAVVTETPDDYDGLRTLLLGRRESMPKRLKQIAAFALEHPEDVAFGTVAGIAEHAGVQPSTLVRFAKSLGYDGFSHLQQIFRDRLRERFPDYRERLRGLRDAEGHHVHAASLLEGFTSAAAVSL
jgi:DNA-binding MurR/RpiR family transcriptional regulator